MSTDTKDLVQRLRTLSRDLIDVNSRRQAVEWCANTDGAMLTAADTIERLTTELANERARGIHSCHADCTRDGCVNRRLRAELARATKSLKQFGFVDNGAEYWQPPIPAEATALVKLLDESRAELAALRERLEAAERLR